MSGVILQEERCRRRLGVGIGYRDLNQGCAISEPTLRMPLKNHQWLLTQFGNNSRHIPALYKDCIPSRRKFKEMGIRDTLLGAPFAQHEAVILNPEGTHKERPLQSREESALSQG